MRRPAVPLPGDQGRRARRRAFRLPTFPAQWALEDLADGYGAYDALARAGPRFTLAHCWAHVRRKFVEAEPHYPAPCGEALALIGQLYAVERACPRLDGVMDEASRAEALRLRATLRAEQSVPIIAEIRTWAHQQRALPESSLGKALGYMLRV